LARRGAEAASATDFAASDALLAAIAAAGWVDSDGHAGWAWRPRPPYAVLASVSELSDHSAEPDQRRATVSILVEGWPEDLRTCVEALVAHLPADVEVVALDLGNVDGAGDVLHELAQRHEHVQELHVERPVGWAQAR